MRILHLIHTPRHSGAEMLVYELCRLHRMWGHECAIAAFVPSQVEFLKEARELADLGVSLFFPERSQLKIGRTIHYRDGIRRFRPNAVFAHGSLSAFYGRFATGWGKERTFFASVMHSNDDFGSPSFALAERLTRWRVDHVIAVSDQGATNYVRRFGPRVPVSIIKNGIDINRFTQANRGAARQILGIPENIRLVIQIGRICDVKQQDLSLRAVRSLLEAGNTVLWFAGLTEDQAYGDLVQRQATDWGIARAVRFLGSRADVPALLAAADLYLMPSRQEAQGIALLEALASGVPIIASDIPAFTFARDMASARICPVGDEDAWRAAAAEMFSALRASRDVSEFSIEHTARAYLDVAKVGVRA